MNNHSTTHAQARHGLVLILMAALLWGTVGIATKAIYNTTDTNALSIGFVRLALATPALLLACWTARSEMIQVRGRDLGLMLLIGLTMALYQLCFLAAIPLIGVAVTTLVTLCTAPAIIALLAALLLGESLTKRVIVALLAGITGTIVLSWADPSATNNQTATITGVALALVAALGYSIMTLCSRALAGRYHPLQPMTIGLGAGAAMLLPFALASGITLSYPATGWALLLYLGLIPTALAFVLFLTGMRHTTATVASIVTLLEPLTATLLAWVLFGERLGPWGLVGAALLLGAIATLYQGTTQATQPAAA